MGKVRWTRALGLGLGAMLAATAPLHAEEATLVADAHVSSARPTVNSGTISNLNVGGGYTSLLQFDLGTLPAGTTAAQVSKAVLRLYCNRVDTAGLVSVGTVGGAWGEYSVTYATLPALGSAVQVVQVSQAGAYVTVDVTMMVKGWLQTPASNNGLALTAGTAAVEFDSKENDLTGHGATLDVSLASQGPAGPAGAAGAAGVAGAVGPAGPKGDTGPAGVAGSTGVAGPAGANGLPGATGPAGAQGAAGPQGAKGNPGLGYVGVYQSTSNYGLADVVGYQGSSYISLIAGNHGNTPGLSPLQWGVIAQAQVGPTGPAGPAGTPGATGATGPQGPAGPTGLTGVTGAVGPQGLPGHGVPGELCFDHQLRSWRRGPLERSELCIAGGGEPWKCAGYEHRAVGGVDGARTAGRDWIAGTSGDGGTAGFAGVGGAAGGAWGSGAARDRGTGRSTGHSRSGRNAWFARPDGTAGCGGTYGAVVSGDVRLDHELWVSGRCDVRRSGICVADGVKPRQYAGCESSAMGDVCGGGLPWGPRAQWDPRGGGDQGATGTTGATGPQGPAGSTGPQGPAVANYVGSYSSVANYGLNDAVSYGGSTYISMTGGNRGNVPDASPAQWAVLVARGVTGAAGAAGVAGAVGAQGPAGVAGATGAPGPPVSFGGGWSVGRGYAVGDAVSYAGSSYIAITANSGRQPDVSPLYWSLLAQSGAAGGTGPAGPQGPTGPTGGVGPQGPAGPQGPMGATGGTGAAGTTGATGPAGPMGAAGPTGVAGMEYRGAYVSTRNYGLNDAVTYGGSTYLSTAASNVGNSPDASPTVWSVFAAAGVNGSAGAAGAVGAQGPPGIQGPAGAQGATGATGAAGANGAAGLHYMGAFSSATNYGLNDGVVYGGATYLSLAAGNRGNVPDANASWWGLLAQAGAAGTAGTTGPAGPSGATGQTGATGAAGAVGATGRVGMVYRGAWNSGTNYQAGDAVLLGGTTYLAEMSNSASEPDLVANAWSVLAQQGSAGPTGPAGAAATVQVGTVTTGAAGSSATVTNVGTGAAAVLNFSIPQGAAGTNGTGGSGGTGGVGTSGIAYQSTYHAVSFNSLYYSVNNANGAFSEGGATLTWVPGGCTATKMSVYSQQGGTITVTLRLGTAGALTSTALACTVSSNSSCTATGSVAVASGAFVDLWITGANGTAAGVWTALACN